MGDSFRAGSFASSWAVGNRKPAGYCGESLGFLIGSGVNVAVVLGCSLAILFAYNKDWVVF